MKQKRRLCHEVILKIISVIPVTEVELITALKWNYEDSLYKAPEENLQWIRTQNTLEKYIPCPKEDWEFEVLSIFTLQSIEGLKEQVKLHKNE